MATLAPVNAPTAAAASRALRETLEKAGYELVTITVDHIENARPEREAAITFPGSDTCFVMKIEYKKKGA